MTRENAALIGGVALLERAINYTLGSLRVVTPAAMSLPTPCRGWNLRTLLRHVDDSFAALHEAIDFGAIDFGAIDFGAVDFGQVGLDPAGPPDEDADPVTALRNRASRLLGSWTNAGGDDLLRIGGLPLTASIVTSTGAIEVAVHGWDIARACGHRRSLPGPLAEEMLQLARLLVTDADRPARFASPVEVPALASPGDRLIAFLGRHP
jgi:uncharacterized protein (TIGR03086 family)